MMVQEKVDLSKNGLAIQFVRPEGITVAGFNPQRRTSRTSLRVLMEDIREAGILNPLVVAQEDGVLADGHRRLACAKALGLASVPVIVQPGTAADVFRRCNAPTLKMTNRQWNEAVARGLPIDSAPAEEARAISKMVRLLGWKAYQEMAEVGVTKHLLALAEQLGRYVSDDSDEFVGKALAWLFQRKMQKEAKDAMRYGVDPEVLRIAVQEDRPLAMQRVWAVLDR